jgi:hypothetical protein
MATEREAAPMRVIAEIRMHDGRKGAHAWDTLTEARRELSTTAAQSGALEADFYRMPDVAGDPFGLDVPTWRIIRTPEQFIRTEMFGK